MTRPQKEPLRPLTAEEQAALERLSRAHAEPAGTSVPQYPSTQSCRTTSGSVVLKIAIWRGISAERRHD